MSTSTSRPYRCSPNLSVKRGTWGDLTAALERVRRSPAGLEGTVTDVTSSGGGINRWFTNTGTQASTWQMD